MGRGFESLRAHQGNQILKPNSKILENPLCLHCVCKAVARPGGGHYGLAEFVDYRLSGPCYALRRGAAGAAARPPAR